MYLAAGVELWKRSALLRKGVYISALAVAFFSAGWISSWVHFKNSQTTAAVKEVVKQSDKNNETVTKRTKEAVKVDREAAVRAADLEARRDELYEAIDTSNDGCDLTDDELRLFNEIAGAASPKD